MTRAEQYYLQLKAAENALEFEEVLNSLIELCMNSVLDMKSLRSAIGRRLLNNQLSEDHRAEYYDAKNTLDWYIQDEERYERSVRNGLLRRAFT